MGLLAQLQSSMDELRLKIASLIERFNEESVEEITALKTRVELIETKVIEIETSPVKRAQRNGSKLAQEIPEDTRQGEQITKKSLIAN